MEERGSEGGEECSWRLPRGREGGKYVTRIISAWMPGTGALQSWVAYKSTSKCCVATFEKVELGKRGDLDEGIAVFFLTYTSIKSLKETRSELAAANLFYLWTVIFFLLPSLTKILLHVSQTSKRHLSSVFVEEKKRARWY